MVWVHWKEEKESWLGITEWVEEAAECGQPAMDLRPIWGGTRGKLTRQRELLRLCEEGDRVF